MTELQVGPIDFLAVQFPGAKMQGKALAALVDLVDRGIIRILDLRVAVVGEGGQVTAVEMTDLDAQTYIGYDFARAATG